MIEYDKTIKLYDNVVQQMIVRYQISLKAR